MIDRFRTTLASISDLETLLGALTPALLGETLSYEQYMTRFKEKPYRFLPSAQTAQSTSQATPRSGRRSAIRHAARRLKRSLTENEPR